MLVHVKYTDTQIAILLTVCEGNPPVAGGSLHKSSQMASDAESLPLLWRRYNFPYLNIYVTQNDPDSEKYLKSGFMAQYSRVVPPLNAMPIPWYLYHCSHQDTICNKTPLKTNWNKNYIASRKYLSDL